MELETAGIQEPSQSTSGLTANALKLIAIIAMLMDHAASAFVTNQALYTCMRFVGRITGPTMFFFVAVGYRHTRDKNRYTLRLLVFALISYLPFIFFEDGTLPNAENWMTMNVIYTILLGLLTIRIRHEVKQIWLKIPLYLVIIVAVVFGDWSATGLLMIVAFDYFYGNLKAQTFAYLLIIGTSGGLINVLQYPFILYILYGELDFSIFENPQIFINFGMFLPIILLQLYNGQKGRGGTVAKYGFYIFYPLHLLILGAIKFLL